MTKVLRITQSIPPGEWPGENGLLHYRRISREEAVQMANSCRIHSCVSNRPMAYIIGQLLGVEIAPGWSSGTQIGDEFLLAYYRGPSLPKEALALPEGTHVEWFHVCVKAHQ